MSSSLPKWLEQVWGEQTEEAFFYFCAWGYLRMDHQKAPTLPQILNCPQDWGEVINLLEGHPYSFQQTYGSRENVLKSFQVQNTLFSIGFPTFFQDLRDEEDINPVAFISMWICLVFMTYFIVTPKMMEIEVVEKCLLLSRNAQCIYREFWEFLLAWDKRRSTLHAPKR